MHDDDDDFPDDIAGLQAVLIESIRRATLAQRAAEQARRMYLFAAVASLVAAAGLILAIVRTM